jgi:hypothetical protein
MVYNSPYLIYRLYDFSGNIPSVQELFLSSVYYKQLATWFELYINLNLDYILFQMTTKVLIKFVFVTLILINLLTSLQIV